MRPRSLMEVDAVLGLELDEWIHGGVVPIVEQKQPPVSPYMFAMVRAVPKAPIEGAAAFWRREWLRERRVELARESRRIDKQRRCLSWVR